MSGNLIDKFSTPRRLRCANAKKFFSSLTRQKSALAIITANKGLPTSNFHWQAPRRNTRISLLAFDVASLPGCSRLIRRRELFRRPWIALAPRPECAQGGSFLDGH